MAGLIPQSFIDDLLNRTDIVEVVSSRVQLKKTVIGNVIKHVCCVNNKKPPIGGFLLKIKRQHVLILSQPSISQTFVQFPNHLQVV